MPQFMVPGMYENFDLNVKFLELMKKEPHIFIDNLSIGAVYGNFQFCLWDGGRIFGKYVQASKEVIEYMCKVYNEIFKVPIRFVFTNSQLKEEHFYDRFCNLVLSICENEMNEIVVNDERLKEYIQKNYPKYTFISSTTKCILNLEELTAELEKDYKYVCLDYNHNHNFKFLDQLTDVQKSKCEFLVNAICMPGCPNRKEHYRLNSLFHLSYGKRYGLDYCPIQQNTLYPNEELKRYNNISPEEIEKIYLPKGFVNFKLEGRSLSNIENACNYARYMVKPEYQLYAISTLCNDVRTL